MANSKLARQIAKEFYPELSEASLCRRELAAIIDAKLTKVREAMENHKKMMPYASCHCERCKIRDAALADLAVGE